MEVPVQDYELVTQKIKCDVACDPGIGRAGRAEDRVRASIP